ncbi:hypothetical protein WAE56_19105 [Iodobacter sp. LRB]|uniref:hypothetical protein n=1 Tax=unclassified Iodobacter TaxID=235634 RepID=UPI000C0E5321|nr:hypothetical protein [Iodobacter sp. BJB302]PHV00567.1 hypothetical protein CSQ88_16690 [Iodobacter sp. BJB302]
MKKAATLALIISAALSIPSLSLAAATPFAEGSRPAMDDNSTLAPASASQKKIRPFSQRSRPAMNQSIAAPAATHTQTRITPFSQRERPAMNNQSQKTKKPKVTASNDQDSSNWHPGRLKHTVYR